MMQTARVIKNISKFPVGANLVFALSGTETQSQEGRSQGSPLHVASIVLFLLLFLSACSSCSNDKTKPDAGKDTSTETSTDSDTSTETDLDGGVDTDTTDTGTETTIADAGVWEWVDLPPIPDSGVGYEYQQLTYEGYTRASDYDVWGNLLVYVDERDGSRIRIVDAEKRKTLLIPYFIKGCIDGIDSCFQQEVTIYEKVVFYKNNYSDMTKEEYTNQIIKVDLEKKTQEIIWSRKWPEGVSGYQSPDGPDIYGSRLIYQAACDFIEGKNTICLFEAPWAGEENQSVVWDEGLRGPFLSLWGDTFVTLETVFYDAGPSKGDIIGYNFDEKKWYKITDDNEYQSRPRMHENWVVWNDWRFGDGRPLVGGWHDVAVFAKDISDKDSEEIQITDGKILAIMPDVFNNIVVWKDFRNCPVEHQNNVDVDYCSEIYGYNLVTDKLMRITSWQGPKKDFVRIWGDRIFVLASENGWNYYTLKVPDELKTP